MNRFIEPAYRDAPARHWRLLFGKYKGKTLSVIPGWYLHFLLKQPRLDLSLRAVIFQTMQQSGDRRHAVDEATFKHAMKATRTTKKGRKERKNA